MGFPNLNSPINLYTVNFRRVWGFELINCKKKRKKKLLLDLIELEVLKDDIKS